jgi:hypothetical protein
MLHTLRFSLQNAFYFTMLPFLVPVLFTFYIQGVLKFKCETWVPKVNNQTLPLRQNNFRAGCVGHLTTFCKFCRV